jgi:hypothetical protein
LALFRAYEKPQTNIKSRNSKFEIRNKVKPQINGVPGNVHARWGKVPCSRFTEAGCKPPLSGGGQEPFVVSVEGKGAARSRQVRIGKTNASEPLTTRRKRFRRRQNREVVIIPGLALGLSVYCQSGVRRRSGVIPIWARECNRGTCCLDVKGAAEVEVP